MYVHVLKCYQLLSGTPSSIWADHIIRVRRKLQQAQARLQPINNSSGKPETKVAGGTAAAVLPELAWLPFLQEFELSFLGDPLQCGIPAEWGQPGAFPSLKW